MTGGAPQLFILVFEEPKRALCGNFLCGIFPIFEISCIYPSTTLNLAEYSLDSGVWCGFAFKVPLNHLVGTSQRRQFMSELITKTQSYFFSICEYLLRLRFWKVFNIIFVDGCLFEIFLEFLTLKFKTVPLICWRSFWSTRLCKT